jgi:hypothetical protein
MTGHQSRAFLCSNGAEFIASLHLHVGGGTVCGN